MTIGVQFIRLCQVQIPRLVLVMGIMAAVVNLFQLIALPYENHNITILSRGGNVPNSLNLTSSHNVHWVVSIRNASRLDEEAAYKSEAEGEDKDYDFGSDDDREMDNFVELEKDIDSQNNFTIDRGLILDKSSTMRHVRITDKRSGKEKVIKLKPIITEQIKKSYSAQDNDLTPSTPSTKWEFSNRTGLETLGRAFMKKNWKKPTSISDMTALWLQSSVSTSNSMRPRWPSARDRELQHASTQIGNAPMIRNPLELHASVFQNVSVFKRSYDLMERTLKVYIYNEGEKPIFHKPNLRGIYASEGWFMNLMEKNKQFVVKNPKKAHLFYLPFSSQMLRIGLHEQNYTRHRGEIYLKNYIDIIAKKYRFWNRTSGADHFLVACHDWAPKFTSKNMGSCIRALCNSNLASGFKIGKDVSLAVTWVRSAQNPLKDVGGNPPLERPILAFFAGGMHGYLRPILLQYWNNKESDMKIVGPMPRSIEGKTRYRELMKSSKYCICARGYEVHTPRLVESIFYECVPVIISDNYVPPFLEVLDWEAFCVFILEKDIPNLRNILVSIPEEKYLAMQHKVKMVQQHFLWNKKPVKYDLFHMILHSIWYNRMFQLKPR